MTQISLSHFSVVLSTTVTVCDNAFVVAILASHLHCGTNLLNRILETPSILTSKFFFFRDPCISGLAENVCCRPRYWTLTKTLSHKAIPSVHALAAIALGLFLVLQSKMHSHLPA